MDVSDEIVALRTQLAIQEAAHQQQLLQASQYYGTVLTTALQAKESDHENVLLELKASHAQALRAMQAVPRGLRDYWSVLSDACEPIQTPPAVTRQKQHSQGASAEPSILSPPQRRQLRLQQRMAAALTAGSSTGGISNPFDRRSSALFGPQKADDGFLSTCVAPPMLAVAKQGW